MSEIVKKIHANDKQIKVLKSRAGRKSFIGGRASGKTSVMGFCVGVLFNLFPRAKWAVGGLTYVQLDSVVLPGIREALLFMGISEYHPKLNPAGVYVVGIQPPAHWEKPYKKPGKLGYQYCMSFINGFTLQFVSQDRPETHRGHSFDGILIDESATISADFVKKVLMPARRGNKFAPWAGHPWNKGFFDFSSASWTQEGMWIYETETLYNTMLEERAKLTPDELKHIPPKYLFVESTFRDNQDVLPDDYEQTLRDILDPLEFAVEVDNERLGKLPNCFYYGFNTSKHCYSKSFGYQQDDKTGLLLYKSNDYDQERALEITLDFNADIVWGLVLQDFKKEMKLINSQYIKPISGSKQDQDTGLVEQLAKWFCDTYQDHDPKHKDLFVYGDPGGGSTSANTSKNNKPFFDVFCDYCAKKGWTIFRRELTSYPTHQQKYSLINMVLEESSANIPVLRINQMMGHNKIVIINLQQTPATTDKTFKKARRVSKDKSSEKSSKNREYATDGTDALDYYLWAKQKKHLFGTASRKNHIYVSAGK